METAGKDLKNYSTVDGKGDRLLLRPAITRSELEHACAAGPEGMIVAAHIYISTDDRVKLIYVEDKRRYPGIRVIMCQKTPLIQCEPMDVAAINIVITHNIALIINTKR